MPTEPLLATPAALAAAASLLERDAADLARAFPQAVARCLHLAARAGSVSRRASALDVAMARAGMSRRVTLVASSLPPSVVDPMWRAMLAAEAVGGREAIVRDGSGPPAHGRHGDPQRSHEAIGIAGDLAGGERDGGVGPPRRSRAARA